MLKRLRNCKISAFSNVNGSQWHKHIIFRAKATTTNSSYFNVSDRQHASSAFMTRADMDEESTHKRVYSTGVLERLVIRNNVSMRNPNLLAGLLEASKPLEITFEDCSKIKLGLDRLQQIAAHCPRLIILNLYCCGALLVLCSS